GHVPGPFGEVAAVVCPVAVLGQVGRAPGGSGDDQVGAGEGGDVVGGQPAGVVDVAIVGGESTAACLLIRHHDPVAGPGEQGDGGFLDRPEPGVHHTSGQH